MRTGFVSEAGRIVALRRMVDRINAKEIDRCCDFVLLVTDRAASERSSLVEEACYGAVEQPASMSDTA
jgi:hypothetical protein